MTNKLLLRSLGPTPVCLSRPRVLSELQTAECDRRGLQLWCQMAGPVSGHSPSGFCPSATRGMSASTATRGISASTATRVISASTATRGMSVSLQLWCQMVGPVSGHSPATPASHWPVPAFQTVRICSFIFMNFNAACTNQVEKPLWYFYTYLYVTVCSFNI